MAFCLSSPDRCRHSRLKTRDSASVAVGSGRRSMCLNHKGGVNEAGIKMYMYCSSYFILFYLLYFPTVASSSPSRVERVSLFTLFLTLYFTPFPLVFILSPLPFPLWQRVCACCETFRRRSCKRGKKGRDAKTKHESGRVYSVHSLKKKDW